MTDSEQGETDKKEPCNDCENMIRTKCNQIIDTAEKNGFTNKILGVIYTYVHYIIICSVAFIFSFNNFYFDRGALRSLTVTQWKGIYVLQFINHKLTLAVKDNGIKNSKTLDMRIESKREISIDFFPGKPPIIDIGRWDSIETPHTSSMQFSDGKWRYDDLLNRFMNQSNSLNQELGKISDFSKLNLLQKCKDDECIASALSQFK